MKETSHQLRRAIRRHATRGDLSIQTDDFASTHRALLRHAKQLLCSGALGFDDLEHFRNYVATLFY
jgi:hypothetical protein